MLVSIPTRSRVASYTVFTVWRGEDTAEIMPGFSRLSMHEIFPEITFFFGNLPHMDYA